MAKKKPFDFTELLATGISRYENTNDLGIYFMSKWFHEAREQYTFKEFISKVLDLQHSWLRKLQEPLLKVYMGVYQMKAFARVNEHLTPEARQLFTDLCDSIHKGATTDSLLGKVYTLDLANETHGKHNLQISRKEIRRIREAVQIATRFTNLNEWMQKDYRPKEGDGRQNMEQDDLLSPEG